MYLCNIAAMTSYLLKLVVILGTTLKSVQCSIYFLMQGPSSSAVLCIAESLKGHHTQDDIGKILLSSVPFIKGGILMFLPSYSILKLLVSRWKETGCLAQLEQHLTNFLESNEKAQFSKDFKRYQCCVRKKDGCAIFIGVYRGKLAEGVVQTVMQEVCRCKFCTQ